MANATYLHSRITSVQTTTNGSLTTVNTITAATITGAGFTTNDDVLVIWYHKVAASTTNEVMVDLKYNAATLMSGTTTRYDLGASGRERAFVFMERFSLGGTVADITIQLATQTATTTTARLEKSELLLIKLSDFGTENADWFWNKSTTVVANTTTYSGTNRAAITWTPSSVEDWIYFAYIHHAIDGTLINAEGRAVLDGSLNSGDWSIEGESSTEEIPVTWFALLSSLAASEHTLSIQTRDDTTTAANDHRESAILLFKTAKWTDIYTNIAGTVAVANGSNVQVATVTSTLTTSQPLIVWGQGNMNLDTVDTQAYMWINQDTATIDPQGTTASGLAAGYAYDATDEVPITAFGYISSESGAQDIDLYASQSDASSRNLLGTGLLVWGLNKATLSYRGYSQAQSHIKIVDNRVYAQGQAQIIRTERGYAQAQTSILVITTLTIYAQANAKIQITGYGYAQSQAIILVTNLVYAQTQSQVLRTEQAWAQSNTSIIVNNITTYAQTQAHIKQTYLAYAQAQTLIKAEYQSYAQAGAILTQTYYGFGQAQTGILATTLEYAQAQVYIEESFKAGYAQSLAQIGRIDDLYTAIDEAIVDDNDYIIRSGDGSSIARFRLEPLVTPDYPINHIIRARIGANDFHTIYIRLFQGDTQITEQVGSFAGLALGDYEWELTPAEIALITDYSNLSIEIEAGYLTGFSFNNATVWVTWVEFQVPSGSGAKKFRKYAQSLAQIKSTYIVLSQTQAQILQTYQGYAQAQTWIKNTYDSYGQAQATVKVTTVQYANAQSQILQTYLVYAQAQAKLNAFDVQAYAQAATWISGAFMAYAQAQAKLNAFDVQAYGQTQAIILATYQGYATAQAQIKQSYSSVAQAQATILQYYQGYAQADAYIKVTEIVYAQAQSTILQSYLVWAQGNAYIQLTGLQVYGQAGAWIKSTYNGYAQAEAKLNAYGVQQYAQTQAWIAGAFVQFAQTQTKINAYNVQQYGQAQGAVKTTYNVYAQAEVLIRNTYQIYAQAQVTIKASYKVYAQAQSAIKTFYYWSGQAQTQIKSTYLVYAQAQAQILTAYQGYANALAQIYIVGQGFANATVSIKTTYSSSAQAQTFVYGTWRQYASAQALVKIGVNTYAQAQAYIIIRDISNYAQAQVSILTNYIQQAQAQTIILTTYNQFGQAEGIIIKSAGYGQARTFVIIAHILKKLTVSDTNLISVILSDTLPTQTIDETEVISVAVIDTNISLEIADYLHEDFLLSDSNY